MNNINWLGVLKTFIASLVLILTAGEGIAYAYLDPGTGSYVFQVLLAMLLGAVFTLKAYWQRLKVWLSSMFAKKQPEEDN